MKALETKGNAIEASILIIGSLLWDNHQRSEWRQSRLRLNGRTQVKVPIRYGRRSLSRSNTFTITLVTDCAVGKALLVPCTAPLNDVESLISEAEALWKAEQHSAPAHSVGSSWGCVGLLFHPDKALDDLRMKWSHFFQTRRISSVSPVDDCGILKIPWPVNIADNQLSGTDVILAIATKPEHQRSTPAEIADAWVTQPDGYERYFFENIKHGIRTSEDGCIWMYIEQMVPSWLSDTRYAEPMAILRREAMNGI